MNKKQSFLQLPFTFEIDKLTDDLACVKIDEWVPHPNKQAYNGSWLITSLTSTNGDTKNIVAIENQEYQDTPLMKKTSYIKKLLKNFDTKIEAVRFMKLTANSSINEHCDKGSSFEEGYARVHIPITTNDDVEFILSGKNYKMKLGHCYYIDAHNSHSVINNGDSDRVHLLIDCHVNDWFKEIFLKGGFKEPVYKYGSKGITDENVEDIIASFKDIGTTMALKMANELSRVLDKNEK
jgi:mannose-6-phosphate isomerase-like protein (cupin superfamily)